MKENINEFFTCIRENTASFPCAEDFWYHISGVVLDYQNSDAFDGGSNGTDDEPSDGGRIVSQDVRSLMVVAIFMLSGIIMLF